MDWDGERITVVNTNPAVAPVTNLDEKAIERDRARKSFREFTRNFRLGTEYIYRDQLLQRYRRSQYWIEVHLGHLHDYDARLLKHLQDLPGDYLPIYEQGAKDVMEQLLSENRERDAVSDLQISRPLRQLTATTVGRLIKLSGIVVSAGPVRSRAVAVQAQCVQCHKVKLLPAQSGFGGVSIPTSCDGIDERQLTAENMANPDAARCSSREFLPLADGSVYINQQSLKLQESPEVVPTGEMPRSISVACDRYLVDKVTPGTRVSVIGILSTFTSNRAGKSGSSTVKSGYIKAAGIQIETDGAGRAATSFTPQEEEAFITMARSPDIYDRLARSIAPSISGDYTVDVKKALACQLLSGSRKLQPDGSRLRGDINILLLGDPSTAKSQLLKFAEKVAPVGVYTSGKGSSAAGLTASVIKDAKGEFGLECGAMVLGDGGVVCIDEFDKMDARDRVAIHEAMEQQTISIAKAGITTVLNSRASVLAAANPIYGRYDELKSTAENIDLMTSILSRFDLIFIVRDIRDDERDRSIARHVLGVNRSANAPHGIRPAAQTQQAKEEYDVATMKRFASYCRQRCSPRLTVEAGETLASEFVGIRDNVRRRLIDMNADSQTLPVTMRQLEALTRIAESLAKMRLRSEATGEDVREAIRLFQASTGVALAADHAGVSGLGSGFEGSEQVTRAEEFLKRRIPIGTTARTSGIQDEAAAQGCSRLTLARAFKVMARRGEMLEKDQGREWKRLR